MNKIDSTENRVNLTLEAEVPFISKKNLHKQNKLKLSRSIALTSLAVFCSGQNGQAIKVCDAFGGLGMASLQWVKFISKLNRSIQVDLNVKPSLLNVLNNCEVSNMCNVVCDDVCVLLHQTQYSFIYLQPLGSALPYLDAAFRSVTDKGFVVVTSCDMPVLLNRAPDATLRVYGARLQKTEYLAEMSVRVFVSKMIEAAARWGKALRVVGYAVADEGITVACEVRKSCKLAEASAKLIRHVVHCQQCGSRKFLNGGKYMTTFTSHKLQCCCSDPLSTLNQLLVLGPMYAGSLLDTSFLLKIRHYAVNFQLTEDIQKYFTAVLLESICFDSDEKAKEFVEALSGQDLETEMMNLDLKKCEAWLMKVDPLAFYFDIQEHGVSGTNPPSWDDVITQLRLKNFKASRSQHGPRCIRTSASIKHVQVVLELLSQKHSGSN